jgi:hypothetical protein
MLNFPPTGTDLVIGLAAFLLGWYVIGLHRGRRRAGALVRQIRDSIQALGGTATIRWIGRSAFRIEVEQVTAAPLSRLALSVLLEPRETFLLWAFGRCFGRRDWLRVAATLSGGVKGAFEVYHPRRRGGFDSAHHVRSLGWAAERLPGRAELLCAAPGPDGRALAQQVIADLRGLEVWGVRVRNKEPHLTVSLPIPASETRVPLPVFPLLSHLARLVLAGGFSPEPRKEEKP